MAYQARVLQLSDVDGVLLLRIGNVEFSGFCYPPPELKQGASYPVELTLMVFNEYVVTPAAESAPPSIVSIGESLSHMITGRLNGARLEVGDVAFEDETLQWDYGWLDGKMIQMKVGRIDVTFL